MSVAMFQNMGWHVHSQSYYCVVNMDINTHRPDASSECHGVGNSTGYAGRAKAEIIISHLSSHVSPQWTVASVVIVRGSSVSETESEIVVTLTVCTPPWCTVASSIPLTAIASTVLMVAVSIGVRSDFKYIVAFCKLWDQESEQPSLITTLIAIKSKSVKWN